MSNSLRQTISSSLVTFLLLFLSLCCLVSYTSSNSNHNNNHNNLNRYNNHKRSLYQVSRNHDNYFYAESFRAKKTTSRPNIIFILTDDQDAELGSLDYMPKTSRYLRSQGATFSNAFSTTPMCCPSRSSMLTGMYVHNHNTYSNNENCSGPVWREKYEVNTFGKLLQDAGYLTGYFGKYLNEYSGTYIPPGWTEWMGLIKNTRYYNYTLNHNGTLIKHRDDYTKDYLTDVITRNSVEFLKRSKKHNPNSPVAMVLSMPAPHGPEDSAPQYQNLFMGSKSHRTPSWNQAPNPDKQWLLQYTRPMSKLQMEFTDLLNTKRLQTLQSVDEAVEKVCDTLNSLRELDNTYIFYTSDHGYHLGQFGLVKGKAMPYEFDIKVPFLVRGPGVPKNVTFSNIVLNLDLAPTFLDIAGLPPLPIMDGSSILKVLNNADESHGVKKRSLKWRDTFLVERGKLTAKKLRLVDKIEAQINNLTKTKNEKTKTECLKPEYNPPCKPNQKWICLRNERDELRFFKCRNHGNLSTAKPRCRCRLSLEEKVLQLTFLKTNVNQPDKIQANFIDGKSKVKRRSHSHHTSMNASHGLLDQSESANEDDLILTNEWSFIKGEVPDLSIPCRIGEEGSVDCQPLVYSNLDLWQKQTDLLEKVIKYFNVTYTNLQKLRDHLNERRPTTTTTPPGLHSDDGVLELSGSDGMGGTDADDATDCTCDGEDDDDDDDGGSVQDNVVQGSLKKRSPWFVKRRRKLEKAKKTLKKQRFALESGSMDPFSRIGQKHFNRGCNGYDGCTNFHDNSTWDLSNHARSDPACQIQGLECFRMDNDHWKVKPFWERGPFCSCGNSNNNTYWCLRTINDTHNFLFCEFITGFISYYDLHKDPYQMKNAVKELSYEVLQQLLVRLGLMKNCRGKDCYFRSGGRVTAKRFSQDKYLSKQHLRKHHGKNKSW